MVNVRVIRSVAGRMSKVIRDKSLGTFNPKALAARKIGIVVLGA